MDSFANANLFADQALADDPFPYYEYLRSQGNVVRLPQKGVVATVGYDETLAVFRDDDRFSAVISTAGPIDLPFVPDADDITAQIEAHRNEMAFGGLVATQDPPLHTRTRSLMAGMLTPKRLRENEAFIWELTDRQIDTFIDKGHFEVSRDFGLPIATQTVADLLGVPEADHATFTRLLGTTPVMPGQYGAAEMAANNPLEEVGRFFYQYLSERREAPRGDVLTELALARYQDGSLPDIAEVIGIASFLFAAGQDTTVSLLTAALRILAETPELQDQLRRDTGLIPIFLEEVLRLEGTVKALFRLSKVPVAIGEIEVPPGTPIMLIIAAANRDPRRFENPHEIRLDRKNSREHLSFGRGVHACIGSPLARAEAKAALERLFARVGEFRIDEAIHGPQEARHYSYAPSSMFRVLGGLHLQFDPLR